MDAAFTRMRVQVLSACVEALEGHPDEALRHLEAAFRLGFRDRASLERDRDLDSIRSLPGFQRLLFSLLVE